MEGGVLFSAALAHPQRTRRPLPHVAPLHTRTLVLLGMGRGLWLPRSTSLTAVAGDGAPFPGAKLPSACDTVRCARGGCGAASGGSGGRPDMLPPCECDWRN